MGLAGSADLTFPPLMQGVAVTGDPLDAAVQRAVAGCDAGTIVYRIAADRVGAALVLAPDVAVSDAVAMFPLCGVGLQNALGALAPPEVAVHLEWTGRVRVNGALCGALDMRASTTDADAVPEWLVVSFHVPLLLVGLEPGLAPEETALSEEGCAEVDAGLLVESWARHTLNWIARWEAEGSLPVHSEWRGLAHGLGDPVSVGGKSGTFLGIDEKFGMLLRNDTGTTLLPLWSLLEDGE